MKRTLIAIFAGLAFGAALAIAGDNFNVLDRYATIVAGTIDNTPIGASTPSTGSFTTLFSTGTTLVGTTSSQNVSGAVTPQWQLHGTTAGGARMNVGRWSAAGLAANYNCTKSWGAAIGTHAVVPALDPICQFVAMGDDGTNFQNSSSISFSVDNGTVSSTSMPGKICLNTAPNASVTLTAALCVDMAQDAYFTSKIRPASGAKVLLQGFTTSATQLATTQTTVPTCTTNCGTSPSVVGTDTAGRVTMGGTGVPASAWVVQFNGTWAAAPVCNVTPALATMVIGKLPIAVVTTTTTMTVTTNGTAPANSDQYQYICMGVQ